jgi:hypothetical protein
MIQKRRLIVVGLTLATGVLGMLPSVSYADVDLFSRRQACQAEAKTRLKARGLQGRELYEALVERRRAYIAECMVMGPQHPASTASAPVPQKPSAAQSATVSVR